MRRTELLQEVRKMRFEEACGGWQERRLTQEEAAQLLGGCERTACPPRKRGFRRYVDRDTPKVMWLDDGPPPWNRVRWGRRMNYYFTGSVIAEFSNKHLADFVLSERRLGYDYDDVTLGDRCYIVRRLPGYDIARIHIEQFMEHWTRRSVRSDKIWEGSFSPGRATGGALRSPRPVH